MTIKTINLKAIRTDGETQARASINNELIAEYKAAMLDGATFPNIEVYFDGVDYWLVDGFHRLYAMLACDKASAAVTVFNGTLRDAVLHSLAVNNDHGLRKSNEDKRLSVSRMLADAEWSLMSDRAIAAHCGCSHPLVSQLRNPKPATSTATATPKPGNSSTTTTKFDAKELGTGGNSSTGSASEQEHENASNQSLALVDSALVATENAADQYTPMDAANDQIQDLQAELVVARIGSTDSEEAGQAKTMIAELRAEIKTLRATLKAVQISRDGFQNQVAELQKQVNRQRREIDRATGLKTA